MYPRVPVCQYIIWIHRGYNYWGMTYDTPLSLEIGVSYVLSYVIVANRISLGHFALGNKFTG